MRDDEAILYFQGLIKTCFVRLRRTRNDSSADFLRDHQIYSVKKHGRLAQLVRAPVSHTGGRGFNSLTAYHIN
jgi:hypothetical protein